MRKTRNGAPSLARTDSACVDLFAVIGALRRHPSQATRLFARAYREDPALALRILLWARDARKGAGEREVFRCILHWLERTRPEVALQLVKSGIIPELGRWDDLLVLGSRPLCTAVAEQVGAALDAGNRLAAKWLPRQGPVAARLAAVLGLSQAQWRRKLVALSDTVEQRLCAAGGALELTYRAVPSLAMARYAKLFRKRDPEGFGCFLEAAREGREAIRAGAVFPHDVVKAAEHDDEAATLQWQALPRPAALGNALVLCDVSGSMHVPVAGSTTALDVCVALGLLLSESLSGPFANKVLTFTEHPKWHEVTGASLASRAESLRSAQWSGSTNIEAAFNQVLALAIAHKDNPSFHMPEALIVLSDMEFDAAQTKHDGFKRKVTRTPFAQLRKRFAAAGLTMPTLVFWNLAGREGNLPAGAHSAEEGVVLVSGYSSRIADTLLSGNLESASPMALMKAAVCVPRYDVAGLTVAHVAQEAA